jgi:hypothetical protein
MTTIRTTPLNGAERSRLWRERNSIKDKRSGDRHKPRVRSNSRSRPFVGCDGEGSGTDEIGRQHYMLFRIGDLELYTGEPLRTVECLDLICQAPKDAVLVGFSFGYDVTMILRDLPTERRARLLAPKSSEKGKSRYTYYKDFGIEYLPRNHFRVCRIKHLPGGNVVREEGSARTIYETFGFFQKSFLKTLKEFSVGTEYLELIERNKEQRGQFEGMTAEVRDYCKRECDLLAELMEKLRTSCQAVGINPRTWNGAGKLATSLHTQHNTMRRSAVEQLVPHGVRVLAGGAYYGGRFEVTHIGKIPGPIYEYDINSAYPAAMQKLPCLEHGEWKECKPQTLKKLKNDLFIADVAFDHYGADLPLCGLPIRGKKGQISWPIQGRGIYWSPEIRSAEKLGAKLKYKGGWRYIAKCDCKPFAWVEPLYNYRKSLGKKTEGYPIKLGINSLYGKLAQRVGTPQWGNYIWASLITAHTRALLNEAISQAPHDILMLATDGVYSRKPLALPVGSTLGTWEASEPHPFMFIFQPGLYWGPPKPKTRGVPLKFFETRTGEFEQRWAAFHSLLGKQDTLIPEFPVAKIEMTQFIGIKLAQSRNKPETAGKWIQQTREMSFNWTRKRRLEAIKESGGYIRTLPLPGAHDLISVPYNGITATNNSSVFDCSREELEDQPDHVDFSAPWKD